jgi:hypothetical protein
MMGKILIVFNTAIAALAVGTASAWATTLDRDYRFGDDPGEEAGPDDPVGKFVAGSLLTFDSPGLGEADCGPLPPSRSPQVGSCATTSMLDFSPPVSYNQRVGGMAAVVLGSGLFSLLKL